ncbi:hypothetical protein Q5691_09140 [Microcoleus sp. w1-18aA5]|uniref:hypothetical protein n=1 Tax=Microcoleus sp. w1-18aA5 TaxID=2818982 RepID=UPI002FD4685B
MIQKIREAIGLFASNFVLFSLIVLTVWLPGSILLIYLRLYVFPEMTGGDELRITMQELRVSQFIEGSFGTLYVGALLHALAKLKRGLHPTYRESMTHAGRKCFKMFGTRFVTGLIVLGGLILFIVPGVILALRYALIDAAVVLEGVEGSKAQKVSANLTQGKRDKIFWTMILTYLGLFIASTIVSFILYLPLSFIGQEENFGVALIYECVANILAALPIIVLFLFYWDAKNQQPVV